MNEATMKDHQEGWNDKTSLKEHCTLYFVVNFFLLFIIDWQPEMLKSK